MVCSTDISWAGRPKLGQAAWLWKPFRPPLHRHAPQRLEITPGWVVILCSDHGTEFLHFALGFKPSNSNSYILGNYPLEWLDFSLWMIQVESHPKIPQKVCRSAGFGPSSPNSVRFGSTLDMWFLRSNMHQNLWNSLDIMVMA